MEEFEKELLENGITERTKQRALQIEYELLKLKNANIQKGERNSSIQLFMPSIEPGSNCPFRSVLVFEKDR